jgi:glutaminyl-peptide cyclotransferase
VFCVGILSGCGVPVEGQGIEVLRTFAHDPSAFTQGLLFHEGKLYESTGRYAESTLREIDPATGEVLRSVELSDEYFAEGLALVGDRFIQITWKEGTALLFNQDTLEPVGTIPYQGDGWGLCYDGETIFMTTGGSLLHLRDPDTFDALGTRPITLEGRAIWQVNELECVGDFIYGNVYMTDRIVKIEKTSGTVVAEYNAAELLPDGGRPTENGAVLNGIAYDPEGEVFYLTGKLWPSMFEVRFTR